MRKAKRRFGEIVLRASGRVYVIKRWALQGRQCMIRAEGQRPGFYAVALGTESLPRLSRILMYHEAGHVESGQSARVYGTERFMSQLLGGPTRKLVCMEAEAWRWAVKAWTERHGALGEKEKATIREIYGTYIRAYWQAGREGA